MKIRKLIRMIADMLRDAAIAEYDSILAKMVEEIV